MECGLIMTNDSMKKSKLLAHQQVKHPSSVGKELSYFEKKVELRQKHVPKPLDFLWKKARDNNRKALKVSYIVIKMIAKVGKPHTIAERLVQGSATYGTCATLGTPSNFQWHAEPSQVAQNVFIIHTEVAPIGATRFIKNSPVVLIEFVHNIRH